MNIAAVGRLEVRIILENIVAKNDWIELLGTKLIRSEPRKSDRFHVDLVITYS